MRTAAQVVEMQRRERQEELVKAHNRHIVFIDLCRKWATIPILQNVATSSNGIPKSSLTDQQTTARTNAF